MKILLLNDPSQPSSYWITKKHIQKINDVKKGIKVVMLENPSETLLKKELKDTDILLPASGIPQAVHESQVKWIHVISAGVDTLPVELKNSPIIITNSSGVHPIPISEHVLGFMLMFARGLDKAYKIQLMDKKWSRINGVFELAGKTVVIVGLGRIGTRIAMLTKALGMKVLSVTRSKHKKEEFVDKSYTYKDLDTVLKEADFVVSALPATPETKHLFNFSRFNKMKPSAYFINIGRGKVVKEDDLVNALVKKKIAGAGLDVFETEPLSPKSPLWKFDNVILTPHISGWTPFYMDRVIDIFCINLKQFLAKKPHLGTTHFMGSPLPNEIDKQKGY